MPMDCDHNDELPTIYVVDDEPAVRDSLRLLFRSVGFQVAGFTSAREFLAGRPESACGCLVTDLRMPLMSGIELIETLRSRGSPIPVVVISAHGDVKLAVRALKAGAADFVEKPFDDQDLLDAVNAALKASGREGEAVLADGEASRRLDRITRREREVLRLVVAGRPNKLIGRELGLSTRTVETHRARVMEKMKAGSVAELVSLAIRGGLLTDADDEQLGIHRNRDA